MKRKVLVFGAGVIGAYLAHVLIEAGNDVTILAREERAKTSFMEVESAVR